MVTLLNYLLPEDEVALDMAIKEAAGFRDLPAKELSVEGIQLLDSISSVYQMEHKLQDSSERWATERCERLPEGLPNQASTAVSTLLVSERKFSGTESVQINEKLINREN